MSVFGAGKFDGALLLVKMRHFRGEFVQVDAALRKMGEGMAPAELRSLRP